MRSLIRPAIVIFVLVLCIQFPVQAVVKYSPGPYYTKDLANNRYNTRHAVEYSTVSGGVYTYNSRLFVDVRYIGDIAECGYALVDYRNNTNQRYFTSSPYPLTYYNTPLWTYSYYNTTHLLVSGTGGGYVKYINKAGEGACNVYTSQNLGGWSSAVNTSNQWIHLHLTY